MSMNRDNVRRHLVAFDFPALFVEELGWDRLRTVRTVDVSGEHFTFEPIAQKRGVEIYRCKPGHDGKIPDYPKRRRIDAELSKVSAEHLIIFTDKRNATQVWQWTAREAGKAKACRQQVYNAGSSGDALIQKLEHIVFPISEEEAITLTDVGIRLKDAFDRERLTKRFYDIFKTEHDAFLKFIEGIPDSDMARWYASVMINRLMFIYFIQAKGFLNGDARYLRGKLRESDGEYYRHFLCPLFFEGFAKREQDRSPQRRALLGRVPYLNGGLFTKHQIEETHGEAIAIPDVAFTRLFAFFDSYNWHLDDRPLAAGNEINPDVLGYIFEKYINQKQMGAYYTKEDITEYISKNTIIPYLLEEVRKGCRVAFEGEHSVWSYLQADPDRYIYDAVRYGVDRPLPPAVVEGVNDPSKRTGWNYPATEEYALPTEIWRETVARRQRCEELRSKMRSGQVTEAGDLITLNLNIRQVAQDILEQWEGADLVKAAWDVLNGNIDRLPLSVLDPTCGSGAFLFAALEILEPLYEACLDRMEAFVADANQLGRPKDHTRFREILADVAKHPNRRYFIYKRIIVNNLYGVDIMEEATEICKLRLFLKLAAQVEPDDAKDNLGIEPLPDIDFNIRAGNTLVGFATEAQVKSAITGGDQKAMDFDDKWTTFETKLKAIAKLFNEFQKSQTTNEWSPDYSTLMKAALRERLQPLRDDLDRHLAHQYGKISKDAIASWKKDAAPFHWFVEFYSVMASGGFDVIIGNPPYVVYTPERVGYSLSPMKYRTDRAKNLYSLVFERSLSLARNTGRVGLIVQLTITSSDRQSSMQAILKERGDVLVSSFTRRPESMFVGVEMPVSIVLSSQSRSGRFITSGVTRIYAEERPYAIDQMAFDRHDIRLTGYRIAKISSQIEESIIQKILQKTTLMAELFVSNSDSTVYYQEACRYWVKACRGLPYFSRNGLITAPHHGRTLQCVSSQAASIVTCILNSSLFYWYYSAFSDCEHINDELIRTMPIPPTDAGIDWNGLADQLMTSIASHAMSVAARMGTI